jgi:hypothetical protein
VKLGTAVAQSQVQADVRRGKPPDNPLSFFEFWPGWLFYTPVVVHWLVMGLRHWAWSLPTAANPRITTGGCVASRNFRYSGRWAPMPRI